MSKKRKRQSTEGITVCCKHWHSHASGPHSLPPSFFRTVHSSHGHTVLCPCVNKSADSLALLYHENIEQQQSGRKDQHSCLNPRGTCLSYRVKVQVVSLHSCTHVWLLHFLPHRTLSSYTVAPISTVGHIHSQLQPCKNVQRKKKKVTKKVTSKET